MKRVHLTYVFLGLFTVVSLTACGLNPATPKLSLDLSAQGTIPGMQVRPVLLDADSEDWLTALKNTTNFQSSSSKYSLERLSNSGKVQDLSRHLNLQLTSILGALRVTGDGELLEKVYLIMEAERKTLKDNNGDGYLDWLWIPGAKSAGKLNYTDKHVMEEIMAHSIVAQAAYAFKLNRDLDGKYSEAASFWEDYLINHYEAKWRERTRKKSGYPIIEKPLFHPYVNNTRYYHYLYKLTGDADYRSERDRRVGVIKRHLMPAGRTVVWSHFVNEALPAKRRVWWLQPVGYTGESMSVLADLGYEGVLDEATMRQVAAALSINMLDGKSKGIMASDVGGAKAGSYYSPFLQKTVRMKAANYPRGTAFFYSSRGYALLAPWDATGKVGSHAAAVHNARGTWPIAPAGVLLARAFTP